MMKRHVGYTVAAIALAMGLSAPLPAQDKSPDAMEALNRMGKYLRTLKEFQVEAAVTTATPTSIATRTLTRTPT
jgi:hypothetical protein